MRVTCDPPLNQWRPAFDRVGDRVIATGHQAWFWHPGILAKDLAMVEAARRFDASPLHLVVDHDAHPAMDLTLPARSEDRLEAQVLRLANHDVDVPTGCQGPVPADEVVRRLVAWRDRLGDRLQVDLTVLIDAFSSLPHHETLAEQVSAVVGKLMAPYTGSVAHVYSSSFGHLPGFDEMVDQMIHDARRCAACYNRAVFDHPQAGVAPLLIESHRVELPLWLLRWNEPRGRIFADLSDTKAKLEVSDGQPVDVALRRQTQCRLAPRALMLTAVMRSLYCGLFIHGRGGAVYDRATEQWWSQWQGRDLAPMALVSADLYLPLDGPTAEPADVQRAVWWAHHLPHNIDRALGLDGPDVAEKRRLLAHMDDDRDRKRRAGAFRQIHRINRDFAQVHRRALCDAELDLRHRRSGLENRAIARRRDWCFALYGPGQLAELVAAFTC